MCAIPGTVVIMLSPPSRKYGAVAIGVIEVDLAVEKSALSGKPHMCKWEETIYVCIFQLIVITKALWPTTVACSWCVSVRNHTYYPTERGMDSEPRPAKGRLNASNSQPLSSLRATHHVLAQPS